MPYDINAALQRLEQNLNDLDSARTQVENAVNASKQLQQVVSEYVAAVETLCRRLERWDTDLGERENSLAREIERTITSLQSSCVQIVNSFDTSVQERTSDFKSKTEAEITKFTQENVKLAERVQEMNALRDEIKKSTEEIQSIKEALTKISQDLKESQDEQDKVLNEIKTRVDSINSSVLSIINKVDSVSQNLQSGISSIEGKADAINSGIANLNNTCQAIINATDDIKTSIQGATENLRDAINNLKENTSKGININRWIIIAGIIILAILQFVIK